MAEQFDEDVDIFVELLCHASIWLMIGLPSINPRRSLGRAVGTLQIRDARPSYGNPFAVRDNHLGKAVYATAGFAQGSTIIRFSGPSVPAAQVPATLAGPADRFMQIAADTYLGPSGRIDDLINHSCAPNAGLHFTGQGVFLVAIRTIAAGEEIAWDYSTTLADPDWRMPCACGAPGCRGTIAHFGTLPADRRAWYLERGLVAPHLIPREARAA